MLNINYRGKKKLKILRCVNIQLAVTSVLLKFVQRAGFWEAQVRLHPLLSACRKLKEEAETRPCYIEVTGTPNQHKKRDSSKDWSFRAHSNSKHFLGSKMHNQHLSVKPHVI